MMKRIGAVVLAISLVLTALPMGTATAATTRTTRCNLRLRAKTNTDSDTLATIPGGTEITVLGTSGGWTKTTYNGHTGYISTSYLMDLTKSGYFPLKEGDENPYVKTMQETLIRLGYLSGSADGKYETTTTEAVKAFQKQNGLKSDGVAGGETQKVMFGDSAQGNSGTAASTTTGSTTTAATTATVSSATLKTGSKGDDVKTLQARLIELGYLSGKADGIFGSATEKAVKEFQKKSSLSSDGKAGKVTQTLLYSSSALRSDGTMASTSATGSTDTGTNTTTNDTDTASYTTLKRGMTSSAVKKLQERLKELGYLTASATGYYGTQTLAAVEAFQRKNGLATDGVAGKDTQKKIFAADAVSAGTVLDTGTGVTTGTTKYATLKEGMKSSAVTTMQKKLKELGYMTANATGYFGSATKAAVVAFQKRNSLSADGVAGQATLTKLYGDPLASSGGSSSGGSGTGKISGPSSSAVKLLHWFNDVKPTLKGGDIVQVYDPATSYGWKLRVMSNGRHGDWEPATAEDTATMNAAFGGKTTWTPKVVYVKLPSGTWTMATTHNTPHLSGTVKDNNFDGHLCVHFLRDMDEATKNDPNYGVQNQKVLREGWKSLTGSTVN